MRYVVGGVTSVDVGGDLARRVEGDALNCFEGLLNLEQKAPFGPYMRAHRGVTHTKSR